jgi:hypothetical protein
MEQESSMLPSVLSKKTHWPCPEQSSAHFFCGIAQTFSEHSTYGEKYKQSEEIKHGISESFLEFVDIRSRSKIQGVLLFASPTY